MPIRIGLGFRQGALGGGGGASFLPSDLSNLQLWLRADQGATTDGTTPAADNDLVQQWDDGSGNSRHATQPTSGLRPTYKTGIINGKPVLRFASKSMTTASLFGASFNTAYTSFGVDIGANSLTVVASNNGTNLYLGVGGDGRIFNTNNLSDVQVQAAAGGIGLLPGVWTCRYNGLQKTIRCFTETKNGFGSEAATGNLGLSGGITIGQLSGGGFGFTGDLAQLGFYNRALSDQELFDLEKWLIYQYLSPTYWSALPKANVIFDGDSITSGLGVPAGQSYPDQTLALLGADYTMQNFGISGQTMLDMGNDASAQIDVLYNPHHAKNIAVCFGGTNDIANFGASGTTAYNRTVSYCTGRRAAGFRVIVVTMWPRSAVTLPPTFEADRQTYNTAVRANWATFADAIADFAADPRMGDAGDELDATYYQDGIHPNIVGCAVEASIMAPIIQGL
jgi:lysophospholipase L1-like esterase